MRKGGGFRKKRGEEKGKTKEPLARVHGCKRGREEGVVPLAGRRLGLVFGRLLLRILLRADVLLLFQHQHAADRQRQRQDTRDRQTYITYKIRKNTTEIGTHRQNTDMTLTNVYSKKYVSAKGDQRAGHLCGAFFLSPARSCLRRICLLVTCSLKSHSNHTQITLKIKILKIKLNQNKPKTTVFSCANACRCVQCEQRRYERKQRGEEICHLPF